LLQLRQNNLGSKCKDDASVAEHHQRQRQQVAEKNEKEPNGFHYDIAVVDGKAYTRSLHDIGNESRKRYLN